VEETLMDIEIPKNAKTYVLKIFPNLEILRRAFDDIYQFKSAFDETNVTKKCAYLNESQVTVVIDILLHYQDLDEYDIDKAFAVYHDIFGFVIISHPIYKRMTSEILIQLSLKPNTFYGRKG
jgi:hypothetical protein